MGGVVHFEIPADDQERARNFYTQAFGWKIDPMPELNYNIVSTTPTDETGRPNEPGAINGGLMAREGDLKTPVITVDVEDINATLKTVEQLGGSVVTPKDTVPGMGYFAYFKDSEGNIMGLWENLPADQGDGQGAAQGDVEGAAG
ncbi:VOC family protein [Arthrobacter sp. CDRTa11]|jgi:predicted enzyme related to lactoylglutathione lyase|uniref:VOC family protein n=1 Tax=Arthrobacter sp. CDRTa11 TaxID=2651199 RepID=UPI002265EE1A|nr:VOC family protein [Arthrobacter sp. CDRTa11]UZX04224.1 VOC family protein [Arthrobacter sp. CDRTa11]